MLRTVWKPVQRATMLRTVWKPVQRTTMLRTVWKPVQRATIWRTSATTTSSYLFKDPSSRLTSSRLNSQVSGNSVLTGATTLNTFVNKEIYGGYSKGIKGLYRYFSEPIFVKFKTVPLNALYDEEKMGNSCLKKVSLWLRHVCAS